MRENFSYKGLFWLPENPDDQISGTLSFSPFDGITLELIGILGGKRNSALLFETNIINGLSTSGKKFSLFKCFEFSRRVSYPGLEIIFYSPKYFTEIDSKKIPEKINLYYATSIKPKYKEIIHLDMLFSYRDIEYNYEEIINNWYSQLDKINSILGLFLNNFNNPGVFNENRFLNIAQALETYHRRFKKNNVLPKKQHKKRLKNIIDSASDEYKGWLKQKLSFSNEPTLKERIDELLRDNSNETINKLIKNFDSFSKLVKDSRNFYTHYDKSLEKKAARGEDLYYLTERMKLLLTSCLLNVIGFDNNLIQKLLGRKENKLFNHLY